MAPSSKFWKPAAFLLGIATLGMVYMAGGRQYMMQREMERFEAEAREITRLRQINQEKRQDGDMQ